MRTKIEGELVYALHAVGTDAFKIGTTVDVQRRITELQTGCPCPLNLVGYIRGGRDLESKLHREFADHRRDGEWFEFSDHSILKRVFLSDNERQQQAVSFITLLATGIPTSFYNCNWGRGLEYQIMPDISHEEGEFWDWYTLNRRQYYPTVLEAVAHWIDGFNQWKEGVIQ